MLSPLRAAILLTAPAPDDTSSVEDTLLNIIKTENLESLVGTFVRVLLIIIGSLFVRGFLARAVRRVVARMAERRTREATDSAQAVIIAERKAQRIKTLGALFSNIITVVVLSIMFLLILGELGFNLGPLIAGASIVGAALAFGAQQLVQDLVSGIFILMEDQYGVGDVVTVGTIEGTVEEVQLRVTKLRSIDGTLWFIRNGQIFEVGNLSQDYSRVVHDVAVGYGADIDEVQRILTRVINEYAEDPEAQEIILEKPELQGVQAVNPDSVVLRLIITTRPGEQWAAARALRSRIKTALDAAGIAVPVPQQLMLLSSAAEVAPVTRSEADADADADADAAAEAAEADAEADAEPAEDAEAEDLVKPLPAKGDNLAE